MTALGAAATSFELQAAWPPGSLAFFCGAVASGWLAADGSLQYQEAYPALFAAIGHTCSGGVPPADGPGGARFTLPNLKQRFPLGKAAAGTGSTLGALLGSIDHSHGVSGLDTTHQHAAGSLYAPDHGHGLGDIRLASHSHGVSPAAAPIFGGNDTTGSIRSANTTTASGDIYAGGGIPGPDGGGTLTNSTADATPTLTGSLATANPPYATVVWAVKT